MSKLVGFVTAPGGTVFFDPSAVEFVSLPITYAEIKGTWFDVVFTGRKVTLEGNRNEFVRIVQEWREE